MSIGSPIRRAAGSLALVASTLLAACGIAPMPVASRVTPGVGAMAKTAPVVRRYGLRFDAQTPKVRWTPGTISAGIPTRMDLRANLSPVDDQGPLNTCTGFAIAGLAEYRARMHKRAAELSPGFIYLWELKIENTLGQDEGARISTGMEVLRDKGIALESAFPYLPKADHQDGTKVHNFVSTMPSEAVTRGAAPFKETKITGIPDLNAFKAAIAKRKTIAFGISCFKSFESDAVKKTGIVPMPDAALEPMVGGHAVLAVGYDDAKQHVVFRNSYGTTWGDKGYGYLPYNYFKHDWVGDAWIAD